MTDYLLTPDSSKQDLVKVLNHLHDDARAKALPLSMRHTQHGDADQRAEAMYYIGMMDIMKTLLWALDGTAINDGIVDPTVCVP